MMAFWWLWLRNRWRTAAGVGIALLALLLVFLVGTQRAGFGVQWLGNAAAARDEAGNGTASGVTLPRSSDPDAPLNPAWESDAQSIFDHAAPSERDGQPIGPQTVAEARSSWTSEEIARREREVLAAVNCAREARQQPMLTPDTTLATTAGDAWLQLVRDPSWSLMQLPGRYTVRSVMTLDFHDTASIITGNTSAKAAPPCGVAGFDMGTLPSFSGAHRIGIAVFPPQAAWDSASAVVLVQ